MQFTLTLNWYFYNTGGGTTGSLFLSKTSMLYKNIYFGNFEIGQIKTGSIKMKYFSPVNVSN